MELSTLRASWAHLRWNMGGPESPPMDITLLLTPSLWHTAHPAQERQQEKGSGTRLGPRFVRWPHWPSQHCHILAPSAPWRASLSMAGAFFTCGHYLLCPHYSLCLGGPHLFHLENSFKTRFYMPSPSPWRRLRSPSVRLEQHAHLFMVLSAPQGEDLLQYRKGKRENMSILSTHYQPTKDRAGEHFSHFSCLASCLVLTTSPKECNGSISLPLLSRVSSLQED